MVTAIIFITTEVDKIAEVAEQLAGIDGVSEVYSVTGDLDLIALLRVRTTDDLASLVPGQINKVPGVVSTQTQIAFRAYSRHDLEAMFSLGGDA